jgi:hypothetical protein
LIGVVKKFRSVLLTIRDSMAGDEYATGGGGADAYVEDMLHPTHWNKPISFYVSSREKKRWHPSLLEHKELLT